MHLFGCAEKLDEILAVAAEPTLRPDIADADSRAATVKQRPTSRRITPAEISVSQPWARALGWSGPGPGDQRVMRLSFEVRVLYLDPFSRGGRALQGLSGRHAGSAQSVEWLYLVQLASMVAAFSASDLSQIRCHPGTIKVHNSTEPMAQHMPV